MRPRRRRRRSSCVLLGLAVVAVLSGCGAGDGGGGTSAPPSGVRDQPTRGQAVSLAIRDPRLAEAVPVEPVGVEPAADEEGSPDAASSGEAPPTLIVYGTLVNDSELDVTVLAATSDLAAVIELHETVEGRSEEPLTREKEGGFVVPAGGEYLLRPSSDHLRLTEPTRPVGPGDSARVALVLGDGSTFEFVAAVAG